MKVEPPAVQVTDEEKKAIETSRVALVGRKIALADATMDMQIKAEAVGDALKAFHDKIEEVGKAHGLPLDDPTKGKWNFNLDTCVFTKLS